MKLTRIFIMLITGCLLLACGRSKEPFYYALNPVCHTPHNAHPLHFIGIDDVSIPEYLDRSQLTIFYTENQSRLDDDHLWAGEITANIKRVLRTNLSIFLPGVMVENSPWVGKFIPDYHLMIFITQYKVNIQGGSVLQGSYAVYHDAELVKNIRFSYCQKIPLVNFDTLVTSMNTNLTRLSSDMARTIAQTQSR